MSPPWSTGIVKMKESWDSQRLVMYTKVLKYRGTKESYDVLKRQRKRKIKTFLWLKLSL